MGTVRACPPPALRRPRPALRLRETCIRTLPKNLTFASRKRSPIPPEKAHQGSWKPSPRSPGCAHQYVPQTLTDAPRKGSPAAPADAHRPLPGRLTECSRIDSPSAPVSAHPDTSRRSSPTAPEKSHLLGNVEFSRVECGGKCMRTPCLKQRCGTDIAASGTRLAVRDRIHLCVDISAANRRRYLLGCFAREAGSNALHS